MFSIKKLLHHFPHYAMKTNYSLLNYMPRNTVLFGNYILLPLDITAAKPYLLLILSWELQSLSSRFDNTLNISKFTAENDHQLRPETKDKKVHNYQKLGNSQIVDVI